MSEKLQNFTELNIKKKRAVKIPHKWIVSVLVIYILIFVVLLLYKVLMLSDLGARIDTLKSEKQLLQARMIKAAGENIVARMKPDMLSARQGFSVYFEYMSSFEYRGVWFNKINVGFQGKLSPNIILEGDAETPEALRYVISRLSLSELFDAPPLRINKLSVLTEQPQTNRRRSKEPETTVIKKENLKRLYSFEVVNDSFVPERPTSNRRRRR